MSASAFENSSALASFNQEGFCAFGGVKVKMELCHKIMILSWCVPLKQSRMDQYGSTSGSAVSRTANEGHVLRGGEFHCQITLGIFRGHF